MGIFMYTINNFCKYRISGNVLSKSADSKFITQSGKKAAPKGSYSVDDDTVRNNLMGVSRYMNKKGWLDAQGRKGKGYGVYRFLINTVPMSMDTRQSIHRMNGATPVILSHWVRK